jgi:hypothetical protein
MIYLNLTLRNPWSDRFEMIRSWAGRLSIHKAWEVEIYRSDTLAEIETRFTIREDHAGVTLGLGLFSYTLRAQFYDTRHWNYEKKAWEVYDKENIL